MTGVRVKMALTVVLLCVLAYTSYTLVRAQRAQQAAQLDQESQILYRLSDAGELAEIPFTDQNGEPFSFAEMEGKVWVGSMFFTTCPYHCRMLNEQVKALHDDPAFRDVQFVSVTVDPETDGPQELEEYAALFKADPERWTFLTGSMSDIAHFGAKILRLATAKKVHAPHLMLVDANGAVRGAFRFDEPEEMAKLRRVLPRVMATEKEEAATDEAASTNQATEESETIENENE